MKRTLILALAAALMLMTFAGCANNAPKTDFGVDSGKEVYKVGVTQFADHPSLDNCRDGFVEGLRKLPWVLQLFILWFLVGAITFSLNLSTTEFFYMQF